MAGHQNSPVRIIRVDPVSGAQSPVASSGSFIDPIGIAVDDTGAIIVTDTNGGGPGGKIVHVDPATAQQTIISLDGNLVTPIGVTVDSDGTILVADHQSGGGQGLILSIDPSIANDGLGTNQSILSSDSIFVDPMGITIDADDDILIADTNAIGGGGGIIRIPRNVAQTTFGILGNSNISIPGKSSLNPAGPTSSLSSAARALAGAPATTPEKSAGVRPVIP